MPVPRQGSKVICFNDVQYRWKARASTKGSEIIAESNETPNGQMLIAQLPKVLDLRWVEDILEFALSHGWNPHAKGADFIIRKHKEHYRLISSDRP